MTNTTPCPSEGEEEKGWSTEGYQCPECKSTKLMPAFSPRRAIISCRDCGRTASVEEFEIASPQATQPSSDEIIGLQKEFTDFLGDLVLNGPLGLQDAEQHEKWLARFEQAIRDECAGEIERLKAENAALLNTGQREMEANVTAVAEIERLHDELTEYSTHPAFTTILRAVINEICNLVGDEDLTDEKLRSASEGLLPNLSDMCLFALPATGLSDEESESFMESECEAAWLWFYAESKRRIEKLVAERKRHPGATQ